MTREEMQWAKNTSVCKRCGAYGHWYGGHEVEVQLRSRSLSRSNPISTASQKNHSAVSISEKNQNTFPFPAESSADHNEAAKNERGHTRSALTFNMAVISHGGVDLASDPSQIGHVFNAEFPISPPRLPSMSAGPLWAAVRRTQQLTHHSCLSLQHGFWCHWMEPFNLY